MHRIGRGGDEIESFVEAPGFLVLRVNGEGSDARYLGRPQCAMNGILQKRLSDALAVPALIDGQTRKQHDWHGTTGDAPGQAPRRFFARNLPHYQRVIADDGFADETDVGLRRTGLLVGPRIAQQVSVQFFPAAVEAFGGVIGPELFNATFRTH